MGGELVVSLTAANGDIPDIPGIVSAIGNAAFAAPRWRGLRAGAARADDLGEEPRGPGGEEEPQGEAEVQGAGAAGGKHGELEVGEHREVLAEVGAAGAEEETQIGEERAGGQKGGCGCMKEAVRKTGSASGSQFSMNSTARSPTH